jgi:DNA-binding response OmpR family regulator
MLTVWNTTFWTSSKTIDVHLGWVRRKLGDDPSQPNLITTVRGHGLRFELEAPGLPAAVRPAQAAAV